MKFSSLITSLCVLYSLCECSLDWSDDANAGKWMKYSFNRLNQQLNRKINKNIAKNIILFLGDGMGISTVTAGRIRKGQMKNNPGEEEITAMEGLPYLALSKTYNIDAQTPDSAGTATAFLSGVKTRIGYLGLDGKAMECSQYENSKLESVLKWAHSSGRSTGIVTTSRITHATPSAAYGHTHDRDFEAFDGKKFKYQDYNNGCRDLASQLVDDNSFINLIFGGGRRKFLRKSDRDYKETQKTGDRIDDRNLIDEWIQKMKEKNLNYKFLWNLTDFNDLDSSANYDHILGLLNYDHLNFETDRQQKFPVEEPSLVEMTEKAIKILSRNPHGYFLLVEGAKIDHAHHESNAQRALNDFVIFDEAVAEALHLTDEEETLIVVTADHSHVFTIGGYSTRGNPIFGINLNKYSNVSQLNLTYTSLLYGNGPNSPGGPNPIRTKNLTNQITENENYIQESAVYLDSETHGGEDVAIYASGPMAFLFDGTIEQSHIAHVMAYSACIGPYNENRYPMCRVNRGILTNKASKLISNSASFCYLYFIFLLLKIFNS